MNRVETADPGTATGIFYRMSLGLLLVSIVWAPIPLGSNRDWSQALLGALLFLAAALAFLGWFLDRSPQGSNWLLREKVPLIFWLAWLLIQVLQVIPLPVSLLETVAPLSAEIHAVSSSLNIAGEVFPPSARSWGTISIAPGETLLMLVLSTALFFGFVAIIITVNSIQRLRLLGWALIIAGLLEAGMAIISLQTGVTESTWYFLPAGTVATGTFANPNHLAGMLEISASLAVGMLLWGMSGHSSVSWADRARSFLSFASGSGLILRVALVIMIIALVLTRSRMGNTAFFIALIIWGVIYLVQRRKMYGRGALIGSALMLLSFFVIDYLIVNQWYGIDRLIQKIETTNFVTEGRSLVFKDLVAPIGDWWITGAGLGSFFTVFPMYRSAAVIEYYQQAHNDYAQFVIEAGLGVIPLGLLVAFAVWRAWCAISPRHGRRRQGLAMGCLMALTAHALHATVEFNLQIPSNAWWIVVVVAIALLSGGLPSGRKSKAGN